TSSGSGYFGARNTSYFHMDTNRPQFYMYKPLTVNGRLTSSGATLNGTVSVSSTLTVSGTSSFTGRITATGGLRVGGGTGQYVFTNAIQNDVAGTHLYLRTVSGGEIRATLNDTTTTYIPL